MGIAVAKFTEIVKDKTNGQIEVVHFPSSQLGTEQEMVESVNMGALDMTAPSTGIAGLFQKDFLIFPLAFVINDWDMLDRVLEGPLGQDMTDKFLNATGSRILATNWYREPRYLYGNKAIKTLDDLKGFRVRTPENPVYLKSWQRLGASTMPIALGEVYSAIQSGAIDGAETTISYYVTNGINKIAPYIELTMHAYEANLVMINDKLFQSLSPENQKIVQEAAVEAGLTHQKAVEDGINTLLKQIKDEGGTVIELDREKWIKQVEGLGLELESQGIWPQGLYDKVRSYAPKS
jgi:tripartite ATP-independent transporter DctP family solute receptor